MDEGPDPLFYREPRFVAHIDDATIAALTTFYRERLAPGSRVLDLMSSWISHLPPDLALGRVSGLGLNEAELAANSRLDDRRVQDLNSDPRLPYADGEFDSVLIAVSVQYLVAPIEVFAEIRRVLRPGGAAFVAVSHRVFPTKAIALFRSLPPAERPQVVTSYFERAGGFAASTVIDCSPPAPSDPLWIATAQQDERVTARR